MVNKGTLIFSGLGLNCETETKYCCEKSGASHVNIIHILEFLKGKVSLKDYDFLIFIGGFLDGDHLGSARVGVNRFKYGTYQGFNLKEELQDFINSGKLILGICNGFQFLVKSGLLPDPTFLFEKQEVSLAQNQKGIFENRWVHLSINPNSPCIFTKGLNQLYLPVRHGEGRMVIKDDSVAKYIHKHELSTLWYANEQGMLTDEYPQNPNGSWNNIAGLSNEKGNIFGLMPHPEAYHHYTNHPHWTRLNNQEEDGQGLLLFKNAYQYLHHL